jgi:hypothetical protein
MTDYVQIQSVEDIPPSQGLASHGGGTRALIISHVSADFGSLLHGIAGVNLQYLYAIEEQQAHHLDVVNPKTTPEKVVAALNKALGNHDMTGIQKIKSKCGSALFMHPTLPPPSSAGRPVPPPWTRD